MEACARSYRHPSNFPNFTPWSTGYINSAHASGDIPSTSKSVQFCALLEHFQAPYTSWKFKVISISIGCLSASTDKLCPVVSEVVYRHLEAVVGTFEEGSHLYFTYLKKPTKI